MKILITGIRGFVGQNISSALQKSGHEIFGLSSEKRVSRFSWDDLSAGTLPEVDAIIHLAGKAHDLKNQAGAQVYFDVNTELTKKIFRWFKKSSAKQFYFFSSVKAAADFVRENTLTEDVVPAPVGPYGESKIAAENFIRENFDFSAPGEKRVYILRPCMIHGRGNKGNLNLLYAIVRRGFPWPLGAVENARSFLSVENLEFILEKMLAAAPQSGIYNLADDEPLSTNALIETICAGLGKRACIINVPSPLIRAAAAAGTLLHLPLNRERLTKLTENYVVFNAKLKRALNIEKLPLSVREGIIRTVRRLSETN